MFQNYRVIVCIPSGRYRYLRVLLPYLTSARFANTIDEIHLWVNTDVESDLEYFDRMEATFPKVKCIRNSVALNKTLYDASRNHYQYNDSIFRFYRPCRDDDAIYVKIDDDICFVHDDFFNNILASVLDRESTNFACVANVFNIPYTSKLLQDRGTLGDAKGHSTGDPRCPFACTDGKFAVYIHEQFLDLVTKGDVNSLCFDSHAITGRQRVGTMAWTGKSFQQFGGRVDERDEVDLTTKIPQSLGKPLWMVGDAIVSHFAFSHQRAELEDRSDVLKRYLELSIKLNGDTAA